MSERPTEHACGYVDGVQGEVIWDTASNGRCARCGVQFTRDPDLDEMLP